MHDQNGSRSLAIAPMVLTCSQEESHRPESFIYTYVADTCSLLEECISTQIPEIGIIMSVTCSHRLHVCIFHSNVDIARVIMCQVSLTVKDRVVRQYYS